MSGPHIHYEQLAQDALKSVVRTVLSRVEKSGLPGDHHFFIAFDTQADGVVLSKRLKEQYPEEMTIVLQHQFWDLKVTQDNFEIKLSFNEIPERLVVPFSAMKVFFDPSVPYGLQFGGTETAQEKSSQDVILEPETKDQNNALIVSNFTQKKADAALTKDGDEPTEAQDSLDDKDKLDEADNSTDEASPEDEKTERPSADIVSLDKFRKK